MNTLSNCIEDSGWIFHNCIIIPITYSSQKNQGF